VLPIARKRDKTPSRPPDDPVRFGVLNLVFLLVLAVGVGAAPLMPTIQASPEGVLIVGAVMLFSCVLWLVLILRRPSNGGGLPSFLDTGVVLPLTVFVVLVMLSTLLSSYSRPGLVQSYLWLAGLVFFIVLSQALRCPVIRKTLVVILFASALVVALHGLHQKLVDLPAARAMFRANPAEILRKVGLPPEVALDFLGRVGEGTKDRVFSTFLQPNWLGGFLALILPILTGVIVDTARSGRSGPRRAVLVGINFDVLLILVWCFYESKSKGAAFGLLCAGVVFGVWALWRVMLRLLQRRGRRAAIAATAGIVLAAALAVVAGVLVGQRLGRIPPTAEFLGSFKVRTGYWRAGLLIAADNPMSGLGPGNFQYGYAMFKRPQDQEARWAHNDYIQIAAEVGFPALAVYLFLWLAFLRRMSRPLAPQPEDNARSEPGPPPRLAALLALVWAAGTAVFALEAIYGQTFLSGEGAFWWFWPIALWTLWAGLAGVNVLALRVDKWDVTRVGIVAGGVAVLAHTIVEGDLQVPGLRATLFFLMAFGVSLVVGRARAIAGGRRTLAIALAVALVVTAWLSLGFIRPMCRAIALADRSKRIRDGLIEGKATDQVRLLEEALTLDPRDAEISGSLADIYYRSAQHAQYQGNPSDAQALVELSLRFAEISVKSNPIHALEFVRVGRCHQFMAGLAWRREDARRRLLEQALTEYTRACELFPSDPRSALEVARIEDALANPEKARESYRKALRLSEGQYTASSRLVDAESRQARKRLEELGDQRK
jgi:hypothetical protein